MADEIVFLRNPPPAPEKPAKKVAAKKAAAKKADTDK
jgi:hypothetical protein